MQLTEASLLASLLRCFAASLLRRSKYASLPLVPCPQPGPCKLNCFACFYCVARSNCFACFARGVASLVRSYRWLAVCRKGRRSNGKDGVASLGWNLNKVKKILKMIKNYNKIYSLNLTLPFLKNIYQY